MFYDFKENLINFLLSRFALLFLALALIAAILVNRIFQLQIVHGDEYMDNFTLSIEKQVEIPSARGNIYDRNGVLLAYNELAYSVTITDTIESGNGKNATLNTIIYNLIHLIEDSGDEIISDFKIYVDENGNYHYAVEGNTLLRFLADIYGRKTIQDLSYEERTATPEDVITYLAGENKFGIGSYFSDEEGKTTTFVMGMGYSREDILKIINIRYNLSLNAFQKYISTEVATDVSEKTVATIMENSNILQGVAIEEDTIRRYNNSIYFAPIIGYTGKISQEEYELLSAENPNYSTNDVVGKTGIEYSMESQLQGIKGTETVYVDNLGKIIEVQNVVPPVAGNDIYLTIDSELQMAIYRLLEQKIAGILVSRIENAKEIEQSGRNVMIPIYDVYFALFNNNVIDINHLSKDYAGATESTVYQAFLAKQESVFSKLREEMMETDTPYRSLSKEYQVYESFIISMLSSNDYGVLDTDSIDATDSVYQSWKVQESISIHEFLSYAISMNWIDITKLDLESQYSDSSEIYAALVDYIIEHLATNTDFSKKLYRYMLLNDNITGKQVCMLLWEQDVIQVSEERISQLSSGRISSYSFMVSLISNLDITPAQLGLEPCSGSCVVTNPNTGEVLALVSYPGYDNNRLANTADSAYLAALTSDLSRPLWNYATQQRTAPGSTFKMISSVAGIEEGVITLGETITCRGVFDDKLPGTVPPKCWVYPGSHGALTLSGAIENSCNIYFYEVGYRLANNGSGYNDSVGMERIYRYADMFGLSEKTGVEIAESEPQVSTQYPVASAIGQGNHNYTTVGLARYVTAIANSGTVYNLSLIEGIHNPNGEILYQYTPNIRNHVDISNDLWNAIHLGMRRVIERKSYYNDFPIACAGKTGTAQEASNKPNHALFVGYAPYNNPEIALAVRIANGYYSDYAAQFGKDVFTYYFGLKDDTELINGEATEAVGGSANND